MVTFGIETVSQDVEMRDRGLAKDLAAGRRQEASEEQMVDLDTRTLALLGKKQRLEVPIPNVP